MLKRLLDKKETDRDKRAGLCRAFPRKEGTEWVGMGVECVAVAVSSTQSTPVMGYFRCPSLCGHSVYPFHITQSMPSSAIMLALKKAKPKPNFAVHTLLYTIHEVLLRG